MDFSVLSQIIALYMKSLSGFLPGTMKTSVGKWSFFPLHFPLTVLGLLVALTRVPCVTGDEILSASCKANALLAILSLQL